MPHPTRLPLVTRLHRHGRRTDGSVWYANGCLTVDRTRAVCGSTIDRTSLTRANGTGPFPLCFACTRTWQLALHDGAVLPQMTLHPPIGGQRPAVELAASASEHRGRPPRAELTDAPLRELTAMTG